MPLPLLGWVALGAANMGLSAAKAAQNNKMRRGQMMARAMETEVSPWTGRGPTTEVTAPQSNVWADMVGGGLNTIGQAQALQNAGLFSGGEGGAGGALAGGKQSLGADTDFSQNEQFAKNFAEENNLWNSMGQKKPTLMASNSFGYLGR